MEAWPGGGRVARSLDRSRVGKELVHQVAQAVEGRRRNAGVLAPSFDERDVRVWRAGGCDRRIFLGEPVRAWMETNCRL
jgi:hypothetical protein